MTVVLLEQERVVWNNEAIVQRDLPAPVTLTTNRLLSRRRYTMRSSASAASVVSRNRFGNRLLHAPSFMQGHDGLSTPHGPCIMWLETAAYNRGCVSGSGISAETILST